MTTAHHEFMITQLRARNVQTTLESIAVIVAAFFALVILPQLLIQYVFAGQQLLEQPAVFKLMPVVIFAIGAGYFIYAVVMNMMREMQARKLEKELFANTWPTATEQDSVKALQAAMKDMETATKTTRSAKTTKTKKARRTAK